MLVDVSGNVADIEKAFHVTLRTYPHPAETRNFFAPDVEPTVAADLPVLHVSGLDNYVLPRPASARQTVVRRQTGDGFRSRRHLHGL